MDTGAEQTFGGVDVSDPDHGFRVHDGDFDGDGFVFQRGVQVARGEMILQRLGSEFLEQGMRIDFGAGDAEDEAEAAGVVKTELEFVFQADAEVVVFFPCLALGNHAEAAGHAEMDQDDLAGAGFKQEVFGSASDGNDGGTLQFGEVFRYRPAEIEAADEDFRNFLTDDVGGDSETGGFDFR